MRFASVLVVVIILGACSGTSESLGDTTTTAARATTTLDMARGECVALLGSVRPEDEILSSLQVGGLSRTPGAAADTVAIYNGNPPVVAYSSVDKLTDDEVQAALVEIRAWVADNAAQGVTLVDNPPEAACLPAS